jgi:hypothetical protein
MPSTGQGSTFEHLPDSFIPNHGSNFLGPLRTRHARIKTPRIPLPYDNPHSHNYSPPKDDLTFHPDPFLSNDSNRRLRRLTLLTRTKDFRTTIERYHAQDPKKGKYHSRLYGLWLQGERIRQTFQQSMDLIASDSPTDIIPLEARLRDIEATIQKLTFKMMVDDDFFAPFEYTTPDNSEDEERPGHVVEPCSNNLVNVHEQGSSSGLARG